MSLDSVMLAGSRRIRKGYCQAISIMAALLFRSPDSSVARPRANCLLPVARPRASCLLPVARPARSSVEGAARSCDCAAGRALRSLRMRCLRGRRQDRCPFRGSTGSVECRRSGPLLRLRGRSLQGRLKNVEPAWTQARPMPVPWLDRLGRVSQERLAPAIARPVAPYEVLECESLRGRRRDRCPAGAGRSNSLVRRVTPPTRAALSLLPPRAPV
jgi:hypothetical protein